MKLRRIVTPLEQYFDYKEKIQRELTDYREYLIFDCNNKKAAEMKRKIEIDKQELGRLLDTEI